MSRRNVWVGDPLRYGLEAFGRQHPASHFDKRPLFIRWNIQTVCDDCVGHEAIRQTSSWTKIVSLFVTLDCYLRSTSEMFNVGMKKTSLQTKPYMLNDGEQRFESLGALVSIMASAEHTGGAFNLFDILLPLGYETPLHIHYAEDVAIHVLEGTLDIFWGEEKKRAEVGSFFFQPRGTPHGFRVIGTSLARISYMTVPAGFDEFVLEHAKPFTDFKAMMLEARYKIEILGSLPVLD